MFDRPIHVRKKGRPRKPKIGDYVILTRWSDADPLDPYVWGVLTDIEQDKGNTYYRCAETNNRWFKNCRVITKEEGNEINEYTKAIEKHYGN